MTRPAKTPIMLKIFIFFLYVINDVICTEQALLHILAFSYVIYVTDREHCFRSHIGYLTRWADIMRDVRLPELWIVADYSAWECIRK